MNLKAAFLLAYLCVSSVATAAHKIPTDIAQVFGYWRGGPFRCLYTPSNASMPQEFSFIRIAPKNFAIDAQKAIGDFARERYFTVLAYGSSPNPGPLGENLVLVYSEDMVEVKGILYPLYTERDGSKMIGTSAMGSFTNGVLTFKRGHGHLGQFEDSLTMDFFYPEAAVTFHKVTRSKDRRDIQLYDIDCRAKATFREGL